MSTIDLGAENFGSTVKDNGIVFVDFWAKLVRTVPGSSPRSTSQASEDNPDLVFGKREHRGGASDLSGAAGDHLDPDPDGLQGRRAGLRAARRPASRARSPSSIGAVRELDMDDVRAQADAEADTDAKNA